MRFRALVSLVFLLAAFGLAQPAMSSTAPVRVLTLTGEVEPAIARYIVQGIQDAENDGAGAVVIKLNTPGGLGTSMKEITDAMLASRVPVIVYVCPEGAWAGSAGTFITIAAHVAAMAPTTSIGAAHPVSALPTPGGESAPKGESDTMMKKVTNIMVADITGIAKKRGRNAAWAEQAIRESKSAGAEDAVKLHVVDFIASDMRDLMNKSDGRKVETKAGMVTVVTKGAPVEDRPMSWHTVVLQYLANPLIAYLLMLVAIYGIIFEINNPGAIMPGVVGLIAVLMLLYSFSVIPINVAGMLLILLAIGLFIVDIKVTSHGVLTTGGIVAFFLGSMMVFGSGTPGFTAPVGAILAGTLSTAAFFFFLVGMGARALKKPVVTGKQGIIGKVVVARTDIDPVGKIFTEGAWWTAETEDEPIREGESAVIVGVQGLRIKVRKAE